MDRHRALVGRPGSMCVRECQRLRGRAGRAHPTYGLACMLGRRCSPRGLDGEGAICGLQAEKHVKGIDFMWGRP